MTKKQKIEVHTVFDGHQSYEQAFVRLLVEKHRNMEGHGDVDSLPDLCYHEDGLNQGGLRG